MQGVHGYTLLTALIPSWDLVTVYDAKMNAPFEPLQYVGLKFLALKNAPLVAIVSAKLVGNLATLSVHQ